MAVSVLYRPREKASNSTAAGGVSHALAVIAPGREIQAPSPAGVGISDAVSVIRTHLWEGWLLKAATDRIGTRTFASGKYVAALFRAIGYDTALNRRAIRVSSSKWLVMSTH
jgi:hypothetical protein